MSMSIACGGIRRTSLVAALALCGAAALPVGDVHAATRVVTNCNNSGAGSLRAVASTAASGDTLDLSGLSCTRITLASEILLPQTNLRLLGRDRLAMTLHGNRVTRVLHHTGTGTLTVERLSVSYGFVHGATAFGGCIESTGNVTLRQSRAHHCLADADSGDQAIARGGAIHADGAVLLDRSSVFESHAMALVESLGGGVSSLGKTTMLQSQVYDNSADWGGGVAPEDGFRMTYSLLQDNLANEFGGGANVTGNAEINKSTVSGNHSNEAAGGLQFNAGPANTEAVIAESTISGNSADDRVSAIAFVSAEGRIFNSTIVDNHEATTDECWGAVFTFGMSMESTVVTGNTCDAGFTRDIGDLPAQNAQVTGSHNLVGSASVSLPPDTIFSATHGLGPLASNGGPTRTHAVLAGSPLIDRGNNLLLRSFDQRGTPFARVRGAAPDIGAFER
ncbi:hypothetical protein LYSHEL_03420 [Lysobacter helvus]|uniref:Right-handed parallel beta-helix repeat-containing protein n=2 Tax=Lysobacteraceae TaxID=32033 RepID=A0ABM7Q255_9GAMM|nr:MULTISPECIES: choice-of-anchor Q domain-containing protein [Lysobacter]BCT91318.1 hypothetical protein LYSCAS_03420 [Lysobacter caseinilyticus]BCT94471.1 hypothetical protein LYSHEL_03420 [Lysobacter helvus]